MQGLESDLKVDEHANSFKIDTIKISRNARSFLTLTIKLKSSRNTLPKLR